MNTIKEVVDKIYKTAVAKGVTKNPIIAVVDFSKPSSLKRMQIIDMSKNKVLIDTWVTHGKNTGGLNSTQFSNVNGSNKSSLGVMLTDGVYLGKHGRSMRLKGLEKGFNDNVFSRAIVVHSASYIGNGKSGRSLGCFALPVNVKDKVIDLLKGGHLLIAYYPDEKWLSQSKFIND